MINREKILYLAQVSGPQDVKKFDRNQLEILAGEMRQAILNRVSKIGGHVGPNLAVVEATIALHYVFNSPVDKIVYDVSHQCYPHKLLTGRKESFLEEKEMWKISGYSAPNESEHDIFALGHTSTSVSLACGLAKSRDIQGGTENVIALIGDGSLSGGEALEGLNNAATLQSNFLLILNDNEMSIAENSGGIYDNLRLLRETNGRAACNIFKSLGFNYLYVAEGNSIGQLIDAFHSVKDTDRPTVIHIHTKKGKGYQPAEENQERWHWSLPFDVSTGQILADNQAMDSYADITYDFVQKRVQEDPKTVLVVAGTPGAFNLTPERRQSLGENYVDVGIAEEHAVAFSSALAKSGCRPIFCVWSSFLQRTYDQLSQDLALNHSPAVILTFSSAISSADQTHLGCFDIPLVASIPNILHLAPTNRQEYLAMLTWALDQRKQPVIIRVPSVVTEKTTPPPDRYDEPRFQVVQEGREIAILALGSFFELGQQVATEFRQKGIQPTVVNPRFINSLDEDLLNQLKTNHWLVITLEDGELAGGFGEKIARFYGPSTMKVLPFGAKKEFTDRIPLTELYRRYHLLPEQIVSDALALKKDR